MSWILDSCRSGKPSQYHSTTLERAPKESRCSQLTGWVFGAVSWPFGAAIKAYNAYQLVKHKELLAPLKASHSHGRLQNSFNFPNFQFKVITKGMEVFLKNFRSDPSGLFKDRANKETFLPFFKALYPDREITEDDFLFTCSKTHVGRFRKPILDYLGPKALPQQREQLEEVIHTTIDHWKGNLENVNATEFTNIFATAVISRLLLAHPGPFEEYQKISQAVNFANRYLMEGRWVKMSPKDQQEFEKAKETLRVAVETAQKAREPFVVALEEEGLSDLQIKTTLLLMFLAGSETSASLLKYLLYQLGQNLEYQGHILEELRSNKGSTLYEQSNISAVRNLVNESLRVSPPTYIIGRFAGTDLLYTMKDKEGREIHRQKIAKGEGVLIAPYLAARDPQLFQDPERFNPNRYKIPLEHLSWLPFGAGEHLCPGQWLAKMEIGMFVTALVQQFQITSQPLQKDLIPKGYMSLKYPQEVRLSLTKREKEEHKKS